MEGLPTNLPSPLLNLGKIAGQVVVGRDPKGNVEVVISGPPRKTLTNDMGYFVLNDLPRGRYEVAINAPEYEEIKRDAVVRPGNVVYLGKIELRPLATIKGQVVFAGKDDFSGTDVVVVEIGEKAVTDSRGELPPPGSRRGIQVKREEDGVKGEGDKGEGC